MLIGQVVKRPKLSDIGAGGPQSLTQRQHLVKVEHGMQVKSGLNTMEGELVGISDSTSASGSSERVACPDELLGQVVQICRQLRMPEDQLRQVFATLQHHTKEQQLEYLGRLKSAQQQQLRRGNYQRQVLAAQEEVRRAAVSEAVAKQQERREMEEDGVVTATDPGSVATDDAVSTLLEAEALEQADPLAVSSQGKELVFAQYRPQKVRYGQHHPEGMRSLPEAKQTISRAELARSSFAGPQPSSNRRRWPPFLRQM